MIIITEAVWSMLKYLLHNTPHSKHKYNFSQKKLKNNFCFWIFVDILVKIFYEKKVLIKKCATQQCVGLESKTITWILTKNIF